MHTTQRIAFIATDLAMGGRGRNITNLSNGLVRQGLAVDVLLLRTGSNYLHQLDPAVRVIKLNSTNSLTGLPSLVRYLRQARPEAFVAPTARNTLLALRARRIAGTTTRIYARLHNHSSSELAKLHVITRQRSLYRLRRHYSRCDGVIAVSEGVAEDFSRLTGLDHHKVRVCPNPVVTQNLLQLAQQPLSHPWFAAGQPPVILGVGRLNPQKDLPTLIRAFAIVHKLMPCRLLILGEGKLRPQLEGLIHALALDEVAALPGHVENPYPYLRQAAIYVLSSAWEGLPNALIEALALGTAVVSTDCPSGAREILEDGKHGRLVPVGDFFGLALAIQQTLKVPPTAERLQAAAARYTEAASCQAYLQAFGFTPPPAAAHSQMP
ncbi:MAG: glycosyltransferase [Gammaproteobacteria bacterium]|nr:glycosyltransferase [Gammaproteobacteria bacterium]